MHVQIRVCVGGGTAQPRRSSTTRTLPAHAGDTELPEPDADGYDDELLRDLEAMDGELFDEGDPRWHRYFSDGLLNENAFS